MNRRRIIVFSIASAMLLLVLGSAFVSLYADWLFFNEIHFRSIFTKILSTSLLLGLVAGLFSLVFLLLNIAYAHKMERPPVDLFFDGETGISLDLAAISRWVKPGAFAAAVTVSIFGGIWASSLWEEFLLFRNSMETGMLDPVFNRDIGFYIFNLPFWEQVRGFLGFLLFSALVMVSLNYFFRGGIILQGRHFFIDRRGKIHIAMLAALFMLNVAFGFVLDMINLIFSSHTVLFGAGYTDIHARLFGLRVIVVLTVVSALLFVVGAIKNSWRISFFPLAGTVGGYLILLVLYPALLQNIKVAPNELALERDYITHHIAFTRFGYDLDAIEVRPFDVTYDLTSVDIARNNATIKNIRLWDDMPLLRTYSQLQQIRTYYSFKDVDNDRYRINGEYMQVMLSPRELSYNDLPSRSWINERLVFTHGFGIAMGPVSRISREGLPEFIIKDIPPVSTADVTVAKPQIYFGELSNDYVIVKTRVPEFDYPTSEGNVYTSYDGRAGINLSSIAKKALFAIKFRTEKILLSTDITSDSRIVFYRNIVERARKIAPFLLFDADPYIVVSRDGKLFWIIDAYSVTAKIPYSLPYAKKFNYIRNSVKVVIDAYDGSVDFYVTDPDDMIVKVYGAIFPELFKPVDAMIEDIKSHIRYPKGYLQIQASMFATFHMTDPKVFYNKEDLWEIPVYGQKPIEPYYTIMKLPEERSEEYILLLPYTPSKRDNLAAWLAGRCDGDNYGKLIVYTFPRDRLIFGPRQIDARIDQDSYISQQLTLWGQRGSQVIRGSLLIIPIENSLLYVQPLYLAAADKGGLPELRRVILAYENEVVMEENLELGLQRLFGAKVALPARGEAVVQEKVSLNQLARDAMRTYERLIELLRQGDWAGYGEQMKKLEQIIRKMAEQ